MFCFPQSSVLNFLFLCGSVFAYLTFFAESFWCFSPQEGGFFSLFLINFIKTSLFQIPIS